MNTELVLDVCLAVRTGNVQQAQEGFNKILAGLAGEELLAAIGDCLLAAYRRQQRELAGGWLAKAQQFLLELVADKECAAGAANFLHRLAFIICDRQVKEAQPVLAQLVLRYVRVHADDAKLLDAFWNEWLSLTARMARRNWHEETSFLLRLFLRSLLRTDAKYIYTRLLALELHFVVYARWDGFNNACAAYVELMSFYLLLVRRAAQKKWQDKQLIFLQLALRSMRNVVAQVSRSLMQDDMDIFRLWYQFLWQLAGEDAKRKLQLQLLLQLAISYWQGTRPKTSKKQVRYLEDLLQPSLITEHYAALLQKIC